MSKFNVGDRVCWGKTAVGTIIPNRFPDMLEGFVSVQWEKEGIPDASIGRTGRCIGVDWQRH